MKIARAYTGRPGLITFGGGFHGRTFMTMALTGKVAPYKIGFGPYLGVSRRNAARVTKADLRPDR